MPSIHAVEKLVRDVFSNEYAFSIPRYQRPYSWGVEQASTLFDDLAQASRAYAAIAKPELVTPYFLGSVVVIKQDKLAETEVIDGQQRLTTLALLISALRVNFADPKRQTKFSTLLLEEGDSAMGTKDRCRLTLRDRDHDFFEKNILRHGTLDHFSGLLAGQLPDPQRRLAENAQTLVALVAKLTPVQREALAAFLLQYTYLVVVSTPNLESAFRIFSVLNDRGLDLSAADIMKAEVIGKISPLEQDTYAEKWEEAEEELGTVRFADLFSHIRMISDRKKLRTTVLEGLRATVSLVEPKVFIEEQLLPLADASRVVLGAEYECKDKAVEADVNRTIGWLLRIGDRDWMPVALRIVTHYDTKPDLIAALLKRLEQLAAVMWLTREDENGRIERHGTVLAEIADDAARTGQIKSLTVSAEEKAAARAVLQGDIYNLSPKPKRTFVLLRLDSALSSGEARYEFATITVEHILPQNPGEPSEWTKWWPDATQRAAVVHHLGNLALLNRRQNSAAKNWEFAKKKEKYFRGKSGGSPFQVTTQVLKESEWTPTVFQQRQDAAVIALEKAWDLNASPAS